MELYDEIVKIEKLIKAMHEPAVSGASLIAWIEHFLGTDGPREAAHIANILLLYGYVYPLTDCKPYMVKNDPTAFYRFQAPYYWISKIPEPDPMEYAIYLVRRTLHKRKKYGLEDYEQRALRRLHIVLARKWEFICMQAADQERLHKYRRRSDQIVFEAQERAFWLVHRPPPNRPSCFDERLPRNGHMNRRLLSWRQAYAIQSRSLEPRTLPEPQAPPSCRQPAAHTLPHSHLCLSNKKSIENLLFFTASRSSYDWFLSEVSGDGHSGGCRSFCAASPWLSQPSTIEASPCVPLIGLPTCDSLLTSTPLGSCLSIDARAESCTEPFGDPSIPLLTDNQRPPMSHSYADLVSSVLRGTREEGALFNLPANPQVRLWATSFDNLLWDPSGCQAFKAFLEKEFSSENLRFWLSVNAYQFTSVSNLKVASQRIYEEFLGPNAPSEINIDCNTRVSTAKAVKNPSWYVFLEAKQQIYKLMKSDSYARFLRSDDYLAVLRVALADSGHRGNRHTSKWALRPPPPINIATPTSSGLDDVSYTDESAVTSQKPDGSA
ncbi:Regulator of G-protein signaling 6 [Taenia solium]|eukprot:TsM_000632300 transcript=TsM_000632300 gene=TsM_000632300